MKYDITLKDWLEAGTRFFSADDLTELLVKSATVMYPGQSGKLVALVVEPYKELPKKPGMSRADVKAKSAQLSALNDETRDLLLAKQIDGATPKRTKAASKKTKATPKARLYKGSIPSKIAAYVETHPGSTAGVITVALKLRQDSVYTALRRLVSDRGPLKKMEDYHGNVTYCSKNYVPAKTKK